MNRIKAWYDIEKGIMKFNCHTCIHSVMIQEAFPFPLQAPAPHPLSLSIVYQSLKCKEFNLIL